MKKFTLTLINPTVVLASAGTSLATLLFGFSSVQYVAVLVLASIISIIPLFRLSKIELRLIFFLLAPFVIAGFYHSLLPRSALVDPFGELTAVFRLSVVICFAVLFAKLERKRFHGIMAFLAASHFCFFLIFLTRGGSSMLEGERFMVDTTSISVTAEIAMGMGFAALLSGRKLVLIITLPLAFYIIFLTQMRIAGLGLFAALSFMIFVDGTLTKYLRWWGITLVSLFVCILVLYFQSELLSAIRALLLFDDPHRGLESGLSGRVDTFKSALSKAFERPFAGNGFQDPLVNHSHNGYILVIGQLGFLLGGLILCYLALGGMLAFRYRSLSEAAVTFGYLIFLVGQPRLFNLQLGIFVGVVCALRLLLRTSIAKKLDF